MANEQASAGHLLSTPEPGLFYNGNSNALYLDEHTGEFRELKRLPAAPSTYALKRCPHYQGPLKDKCPEEVAFMIAEAIDYFAIDRGDPPPMPHDGMRGVQPLKANRDALDFWSTAMGVLAAMANGKPRVMEMAWRELGMMRLDEQRKGVADYIRERTEREAAEAIERYDNKDRNDAKRPVYFIGSKTGAIKIGVANKPHIRLKELQTGHHERLEIIVTTKGGMKREAEYHRLFAAHRLHGEWFERCPAILSEIERLSNV